MGKIFVVIQPRKPRIFCPMKITRYMVLVCVLYRGYALSFLLHSADGSSQGGGTDNTPEPIGSTSKKAPSNEPIGSTSKKALSNESNNVHQSPAKVKVHTSHSQASSTSNSDKPSMTALMTTKRASNPPPVRLVDHSSLVSDHPLQSEGDRQQCQVRTNAHRACVLSVVSLCACHNYISVACMKVWVCITQLVCVCVAGYM